MLTAPGHVAPGALVQIAKTNLFGVRLRQCARCCFAVSQPPRAVVPRHCITNASRGRCAAELTPSVIRFELFREFRETYTIAVGLARGGRALVFWA